MHTLDIPFMAKPSNANIAITLPTLCQIWTNTTKVWEGSRNEHAHKVHQSLWTLRCNNNPQKCCQYYLPAQLVEIFPMFRATKNKEVSNKTGKSTALSSIPNLLGKIESKLQDATHQNGSQGNGKDHLHPIARSHEPPSCRCDNAATNVWWLQPTWHRDRNVLMLVASYSLAADTWKACPNHSEYRNCVSNRSNFNTTFWGAKRCAILDSAQSRKHPPFPHTYPQPCRNQDPTCHEACLVFVRNPSEICTKHTCKA